MQSFYDLLHDKAFDVVDFFSHRVIGVQLNKPLVPEQIQIQIHQSDPKSIIWVDSKDYPGLFASGSNPVELWESLNDAIYSYFGVPRYIAKKSGNIYSLPFPDGTAIVERPKENLATA